MNSKQQLRKQYLKKRMDLSPEEYQSGNDKLLNHFESIDLEGIKCIHLFLPMLERREPDTFLIIDWLKQNCPDIKLAFSKSDFATTTLQHFLDDEHLEIDSNDFGIPEPIAGTPLNVTEIDMVVVPLLAFDKQGYRVGYGKGFYDRFMAECKPGTQFVGLSFFEPVNAIEDVNEYDVRLHKCLTVQNVWMFN